MHHQHGDDAARDQLIGTVVEPLYASSGQSLRCRAIAVRVGSGYDKRVRLHSSEMAFLREPPQG
jgi:hypothetical protein